MIWFINVCKKVLHFQLSIKMLHPTITLKWEEQKKKSWQSCDGIILAIKTWMAGSAKNLWQITAWTHLRKNASVQFLAIYSFNWYFVFKIDRITLTCTNYTESPESQSMTFRSHSFLTIRILQKTTQLHCHMHDKTWCAYQPSAQFSIWQLCLAEHQADLQQQHYHSTGSWKGMIL